MIATERSVPGLGGELAASDPSSSFVWPFFSKMYLLFNVVDQLSRHLSCFNFSDNRLRQIRP